MGKIFDAELIAVINLFEKVTRARVKDTFTFKDRLTFVVEEGDLGKALGKGLANLKKIEEMLKRKVRIVEYHPDKLQFILKMIYPLKATDISEEEGIVTIRGPDTKTRGLMIGARAQNLRALEEVVRRFFDVKEIKVV